MSDEIRFSIDGPLARITIHRPPLNILSTAMLDAVEQGLMRAADDERVRLIRLDAEGKLFSAGVDVLDHVGDKVAEMMASLERLFETFEHVRQPTVSVVHGAALGGGCELALGTDMCVASEGASFGQPEVRLGLYAPPASVLLPRLIGERRALWLLLTGETIPANEAGQMGLVSKVLPEAGFADAVDELFERLLSLSGSALCQAKQAVRRTRGLPVGEAHRTVNRAYLEELMSGEDAHEGLRAFMDKRPPVWTHR